MRKNSTTLTALHFSCCCCSSHDTPTDRPSIGILDTRKPAASSEQSIPHEFATVAAAAAVHRRRVHFGVRASCRF
uniref:Putative secreted protein n=1 Tax=Anopheles marajoara TaxID=58244 RepID=A0A2M4CD42_9DIPT